MASKLRSIKNVQGVEGEKRSARAVVNRSFLLLDAHRCMLLIRVSAFSPDSDEFLRSPQTFNS